MRYRFCILLLFISVMTFAQQMNKTELDNLLTQLQLNATKVETIQCDFMQTQHLKVVKQDIVNEGKFYFKANDNVCLKYTKPQGDMLLLTGTKFVTVNKGKQTTLSAKNNPMAKQIKALMTCSISGDLDRIVGKQGVLKGEETINEFVVKMEIKQQTGGTIDVIVLHIDKNDYSLNNLKIIESNGNSNEYRFINKQFNVSVDNIFK